MWAILAVVLLAAYIYSESGSQKITTERAKALIKQGASVVDVRTDIEWNLGHYPNAIHIPTADIKHQNFLKDKNEVIIVYCNTGQRARVAAEALRDQGFKNVFYISSTYVSLL